MGFLAALKNVFTGPVKQPDTSEEAAEQGNFGKFGGVGAVRRTTDQGSLQVASVNSGVGKFKDAAGETQQGVQGDAQLLKLATSVSDQNPVGVEMGALTASAGATTNASTTQAGAQANILEGALAVGNDSHNVRLGASIGVGAAGRAHYGDADKDGLRELGFGLDAGPISFDMKTEALHSAWNWLTGAGKKDAAAGDAAAPAPPAPATNVAAPPPAPPVQAPVPAPAPVPPPRLFPNSPLASDEDVHERLTR